MLLKSLQTEFQFRYTKRMRFETRGHFFRRHLSLSKFFRIDHRLQKFPMICILSFQLCGQFVTFIAVAGHRHSYL
ncbi:hypothetical protein IP91_00080 [Pseudoduganella lurida]|uniref:Uncharacterized protein n=1 Tax=Pseudoduganella lurida TaxID=1036180 RepID=A0A562RIW5_9BURK|nr:hypothetical protein IP91_00080 [Pseudoduganella lurida]